VGTQTGDFAREILERTRPRALHLIDISWGALDPARLDGPPVHRHTGMSHTVLGRFEDAMFDWFYIDADHSFDGVMRDIAAARSKVRPGGYLVFNDFAVIDPHFGRYGVQAAVTRFIVEARWPLSHLALSSAGLYDVAVRRPM
jgi:SAM-dependent methyltransferase